MRVFLNGAALSPKRSAVYSPTSLILVPWPDVVAGNKVAFRVFLVDGKGAYDPISGDVTGYSAKLGLGDVATQVILTQVAATRVDETIAGVATSGWQCILDLGVAAIMDDVENLNHKNHFIEFQIKQTAGDAEVLTLSQQEIILRNRILP